MLRDAFHCSLLTDILNQSLLDGKYASATCMVHPPVSTNTCKSSQFYLQHVLYISWFYNMYGMFSCFYNMCGLSPVSTTRMISPDSTQFLVNRTFLRLFVITTWCSTINNSCFSFQLCIGVLVFKPLYHLEGIWSQYWLHSEF